MFRLLALIFAVLILLAVLLPDARAALAWVLAFFSQLMLADLIRSSLRKAWRSR